MSDEPAVDQAIEMLRDKLGAIRAVVRAAGIPAEHGALVVDEVQALADRHRKAVKLLREAWDQACWPLTAATARGQAYVSDPETCTCVPCKTRRLLLELGELPKEGT